MKSSIAHFTRARSDSAGLIEDGAEDHGCFCLLEKIDPFPRFHRIFQCEGNAKLIGKAEGSFDVTAGSGLNPHRYISGKDSLQNPGSFRRGFVGTGRLKAPGTKKGIVECPAENPAHAHTGIGTTGVDGNKAAERAAISGAVAVGVTADHRFDRTGSHEAIGDGTAGAHRGSAGSDHGRSIGADVNRGYPLLEQTIKIF